ncbi:MAG: D-alanyl-D-alanine carboxypeptidase/D-alanyl-D-alanine-endopeptidase [Bacteroidota bacterium]
MLHPIEKYLVGAGLVFACFISNSCPCAAQTATEVIHAAQNQEALRSATIGFYAINLTNDKVIGSYNADTSITPASALKILTTATALEVLGPNHRFTTTIQHDGQIDAQGTLRGNIYIKGGGDPMLGSSRFKQHYYAPYFIDTWVKAIKAKGIQRIVGAVVGDATIYTDYDVVPSTWVVGDLGMYYGAVVSGLSIFDNTFSVKLQAPSQGQAASLVAVTPALPPEVQLMLQVHGADIKHAALYNVGYPYTKVRTIIGSIPCAPKVSHTQVTIPDAAYWAAYTLQQALRQQGVEVVQAATTMRRGEQSKLPRNHLYTTCSPTLGQLLKAINLDSVNSYAEHLVKHLGRVLAEEASTQEGIKTIRKFWAKCGINVNGMFLYDGSGLSRYNALTPKQLVEVLCRMKHSNHFSVFYHSLPVAGKTGRLIHPMLKKPPLYGRLRIKSGRLSRCRTFVGYGKNKRNEDIAFALFIVNYDSQAKADEALEQILTAMVQQE